MAVNSNEIQLSNEQLRQALKKALDEGDLELADSITDDIIARESRESLPKTVGDVEVDTSPVELPPQTTTRLLGAEKPPFFDPSGPQLEVTQNRGFSPKERDMAARGIDVTQELDAPDIRTALGFSPNEDFSASFLAEKLSEKTGLPKSDVVRFDETGTLVALQGNRFVPLDSSSLTMNDLRDLYGPARPIGMAVGLGIAGSFASPLAGVGTGAMGAGWGEFIRLQKGKELGVHDLSTEDMMGMAFKELLIDAVAGAGGLGATRVSQILRDFIVPPPTAHGDFTEQTAEDLIAAINRGEFADDIATINRILDDSGSAHRLKLDPVALSQDPMALELRDAAVQGNRSLKARHAAAVAENQAALDDYGKILLGLDLDATPFRPGAPRSDLGRDVQARLRAEANTIQAEADTNLRLAAINANKPLAHYGRLDPDTAGERAGEIISAYGNGLRAVKDDAYVMYSRAIGQPVAGDEGFTQATRLTSRIQVPVDQAFADFAKAQRTIKRASLLTEAVAGENALKIIPKDQIGRRRIDLALLDNNIKWLNGRIDAKDGAFPVERLIAAKKVLTQMREDFLAANHPDVLNLLNKAQIAHGEYQDFLKKGVLSKIISETPDGVLVTSNANAFKHIFARENTQALRELMDIAKEVPGATAQLEKTVLQIYKANVAPGGVLMLDLHQKFVKEHRGQLEAVFGSNARVFRFGELAKIVDTHAAQAKATRDALSKSALARMSSKEPGFAGQVGLNTAGVSPELLGSRVLLKGTSADDVLEVVRVLETDPRLLRAFQQSVGRQMYEQLMPGGQINMKAIPKFVERGGNLEKLTHVFGEQYVDDLGKLWRGMLLNAAKIGSPKVEKTTPFGLLARTLITPPLTKRGRAQTFVEHMRADAISEAIYNAITSPDLLHALVAQGHKDVRSRGVMSVFSQMSALSALHSMDDSELGLGLQGLEDKIAAEESERIRSLAE